MTVGTHRVTVYGDPAAGQYGPTLVSNSFFLTDLAGWVTGPYATAWTWNAGAATFTGTTSALNRSSSTGILARPGGIESYRCRAVVNVDKPARVTLRIYYGTTTLGASQGPFWQPSTSTQQFLAVDIPAGTSLVEATFPDTVDPKYVYVAPVFDVKSSDNTAFTCRLDSMEMSTRRSAASADVSCWVDDVAIVHGRSDTTSAPEASSCTLNLTSRTGDPLPAVVDVGAAVTVTTTVGTTESTRFTGRVTDVQWGWDDEGKSTPDAGVGQVVAVGLLSDLGRRIVGDTPFPQELDGARVQRVLTLAGYPLDAAFSDPGTVQILPRDVDAQPALGVVQETAASAGGMVWETTAGEVRYADSEHRRNTAIALTLDACDMLVTPTWTRNTDGLINEVSIEYGAEPAGGGERPRYTAKSDPSRAKWGRYALSTATELAALADASAMGSLLLIRNSSPVWVMSAIPVDVESLTDAETVALLGLDVHGLVQLTGLPAIGLAPTQFPAWVEGWTERLSFGEHELSLYVSDYCRTAPPPRWNDVNPAWTWDSTPGTWDEMACLGPTPSLGRWDDVSATLRWDQVAPAVTWDKWGTPATAALQKTGT